MIVMTTKYHIDKFKNLIGKIIPKLIGIRVLYFDEVTTNLVYIFQLILLSLLF